MVALLPLCYRLFSFPSPAFRRSNAFCRTSSTRATASACILSNARLMKRGHVNLGRGVKFQCLDASVTDGVRHCGLVQLEFGPAVVVAPAGEIDDLGALGCRLGGFDRFHDVPDRIPRLGAARRYDPSS